MTQSSHRPDIDTKNAIVDELRWTPSVDPTHIGVAVNQGAVTLSGEVDSYPELMLAQKAALRVRGVTAIAQELTVRKSFAAGGDTDLARQAGEAIDRAVDVPAGAVKVTVHSGVLTLTGALPWDYQRQSALRSVRYLRGVLDVRNCIVVKPTVSAAQIKTEIASAMLRSAAVDARRTSVTTDTDGTVTLHGTVHSWSERHQAEQVAWAAPGVTAVVNELLIQGT